MVTGIELIKSLARGQWPAILSFFGVPDSALRNKHGPCPFCGGKDRFRFDDKGGDGTFICNRCGAGDGIALLARYRGESVKNTLKTLSSHLGMAHSPLQSREITAKPLSKQNEGGASHDTGRGSAIKTAWKESVPLLDPMAAPVRLYLERRLGHPATDDILARLGGVLKFHPALPFYEGSGQGPVAHYPALVAAVTVVNANDGGIEFQPVSLHRTYLTNNGQKAPVENPKKLMRPIADGATNGAVIPLVDIDLKSGVLGVAEGIETAIACHLAVGIPVWSTVSAGSMKSFAPPPGAKKLVIFADNDPAGLDAANELAQRALSSGATVFLAVPPGGNSTGKAADWLDIYAQETANPTMGVKEVFRANTRELPVTSRQSKALATNDPEPISLVAAAPPEMPVNIFKGWFGDMVRAVAAATETPHELAAMMGLASVSIAVQRKFLVEAEIKYHEPVCIWTLAALDSGNRKTAVLHAMVHPIVEFESELAAQIAPERERAISEKKTLDARITELRARAAKAKASLEVEDLKREIAEIERSIPEIPSPPRLWAQDITPEKLGALMADNGERMGILSDEGVFFAVLAGLYNGGTLNLDLVLQAHSGAPVRVDRGSRPSVYMQLPALTLGLSPQPEILRGLANHREFRGRGLFARFLFALPQSKLGFRTLDAAPVADKIEDAYNVGLRLLLQVEPARDVDGATTPYIVRLTPEAHAEWKEFARTVEVDMRDGGRFEHARDWAGKLPGQAIRLAGLLHCAESETGEPWKEPISIDVIERALELAAVLSYHALAVFELIGADPALEGAKRIASWIDRSRQPGFTARDCFNALKGHFKKMEAINAGFEVLIERHYIFEEDPASTGPGRPSRKFRVNSRIMEGWK